MEVRAVGDQRGGGGLCLERVLDDPRIGGGARAAGHLGRGDAGLSLEPPPDRVLGVGGEHIAVARDGLESVCPDHGGGDVQVARVSRERESLEPGDCRRKVGILLHGRQRSLSGGDVCGTVETGGDLFGGGFGAQPHRHE